VSEDRFKPADRAVAAAAAGGVALLVGGVALVAGVAAWWVTGSALVGLAAWAGASWFGHGLGLLLVVATVGGVRPIASVVEFGLLRWVERVEVAEAAAAAAAEADRTGSASVGGVSRGARR
jgi:hypothetical protein